MLSDVSSVLPTIPTATITENNNPGTIQDQGCMQRWRRKLEAKMTRPQLDLSNAGRTSGNQTKLGPAWTDCGSGPHTYVGKLGPVQD